MGKFFPPVVAWVLLAMACGDGHRAVLFTAPGRASAPSPTSPSPFAFAERYTTITLGDVIDSRVTADDLLCEGFPEFRCQYFRLTAPSAVTLEVMVTKLRGVSSQLQDVSITDSGGTELWGSIGGRVTAALRAGTTYQITVWYAEPGVEFELRTSLRPN